MNLDPNSDSDQRAFGSDDEAATRAAAEALAAQRPTPQASFRGALAQRLSALDPGFGHIGPGLGE